ncbi:MAG: GNAT family N-acetyltransferase [bacterium]
MAAFTVIVRTLSWPTDHPQLERLDLAFHTDVVYDVQSRPRGFALVERPITPAIRKTYHVEWNELLTDSVTVVAEHENVIVGVAALRHVAWNNRAVVTHLYVDGTARGHGVGTQLVQELRKHAAGLHARCLWVETQNVNVPAIRFYEKNGFVFSGLDVSLYDPRTTGAEIALYFTLPIPLDVGDHKH